MSRPIVRSGTMTVTAISPHFTSVIEGHFGNARILWKVLQPPRQRRRHGRLRRLTAIDRQRKAARNRRRGRMPSCRAR